MPLTFITGPVRSGKSRLAQRLALESGKPVLYVAGSNRDPADAEWAARIAAHEEDRPDDWRVLEMETVGAPELAELLRDPGDERTLLFESLGTWFAASLARSLGERQQLDLELGERLERRLDALVSVFAARAAETIVVGEEVGWGIVPEYPSGRLFRDVMGRAQQRLARLAQRAFVVVDGYALDLHALGRPVDGGEA